ncbi:hypothetical protein OHA70_37525 [Kribbella sp. NBC_00382]|uniref:hypothetical protein n=1 Tax=Kribbella sp. NBC_00382 TaxID=2975967 RepID=UPI002E216815
MRLYVAVREGDLVGYSAFGEDIAWLMADSEVFDRSAPARQRWEKLDQTVGSVACSVEVGEALSIRELTATALTAAQAAGLVADPLEDLELLQIWLEDAATGQVFELDETVSAAGLLDDDVVVLCIEHPPMGMYELLPAPNPTQVFAQLQYAELKTAKTTKLHGVLLYTDADVELATFVRTHFDELNALSGELFQISVLERPQKWRTVKRYWKDSLDPDLYRMLSALRWLNWTPYDKLGAYEVARELGVRPGDLPCLVLQLRGGDSRDRFVFPVRNADLGAFRELLGDLSRILNDEGQGVSENLPARLALRKSLMAAGQRLRAEVVPAAAGGFEFKGATVFIHSGGQAMTENFNFHGQTTFINRPVNTVITDFQNSHGAGTDLAGLLRLVLTSEQLTDEQREQVAQLINEVAGELDTGAPDGGKTRTQLERIKTTVSKAADIATPALTIIAKVLELLP